MTEEAERAAATGAAVSSQLWRRQVRRQLVYLGLTAAAVALAALALGMIAVGLQSGRDEARGADLALVVVSAVPTEPVADHTFELYRRGYVPVVIVVGEGREGLKAQLVERGMPEEQVGLGGAAGQPGVAALQTLAREAHTRGATSLLVVTEPAETLTALKIARDQGLRAYGSPAPGSAPQPLGLALASVRYWQYVLIGLLNG